MSKPEVIILAAGYGSRLQDLLQGKPKPLINFENEPLLHRTVRQFHEIDYKNIKIVVGYKGNEVETSIKTYFPSTQIIYNDRFDEDKNIYSLICGLQNSNSSAIIIEGDVALSDRTLPDLQNSVKLGTSFWASCGFFKSYQQGGIIKADSCDNIEQVLYTSYSFKLKNYYKNLGLIFCNANDIQTFKILLDQYASKSLDQYYMTPWSDNFKIIPAKLKDIGENGGASFNTIREYDYAVKLITNFYSKESKTNISLSKINELKHIESFDTARVDWLAEKIKKDNAWTTPLVIDNRFGLVMDGQHRLEAAILLGLRFIPVIKFSYNDVKVWSLRPESHEVTVEEIIRRGLEGNLYPYKTAKHQFPHQIKQCFFSLNDLR